MKSPTLALFTFSLTFGFLASCGGEKTDEPEKKPEFADTKVAPKEDPKPEKVQSSDKTDEEIAREERRAERERRGREMFDERDADGDGALTQEEATNLGWLLIEQADDDGDGKVTYEDIQLAREEGRIKAPTPTRAIEVMDTDGDGAIGGEEIPERFRQGISFVDIDGDSKISLAELENIDNMRRQAEERRRQSREGNGGEGGGDIPPL